MPSTTFWHSFHNLVGTHNEKKFWHILRAEDTFQNSFEIQRNFYYWIIIPDLVPFSIMHFTKNSWILVTPVHHPFSDKLWCMNKSSSQNLGNKFLSVSCDILYCLLPSMSESNLGALLKIILLMYQPFFSEVIFILFGCNCFDTINHFLILQCDNDSMNAFPMHFLNRKFDRPWISCSLPC